MAAAHDNSGDHPARGWATQDVGRSVNVNAYELSYARLPATAARMFRLLPVNPGPHVCTPAAAALAGVPSSQARKELAILARCCLVDAAPDGGERWTIECLIQLFARQLSDAYADADGREQARDRLLGYYLSMTDAADGFLRMLPGVTATVQFDDQDSAVAWLDAERANLTAAVHMAAETGRNQTAMRLPLLLAEYLAKQRRFDDLLATTAIGVEAARQAGDRRGEGDTLNNRGGALLAVGRFGDAVPALEAAIAIYQETKDRDGEGDALNNLGIGLRGILQLRNAIAAHEAAIAIYQETKDRHSEGNALNNLGIALRQSGRVADAIAAHEAAIAIYQETKDRHSERTALENLNRARAA